MRNLTVAIDDEVFEHAAAIAAARGTSLPALVTDYLNQLAPQRAESAELKRQEREIREQITAFHGSVRLSREEIHQRKF